MATIYLFDVDGTLTPPRLPMDEDFVEEFLEWVCGDEKSACLVTGSDMAKVKEQVPEDILRACKGIFTCMANQYWVKNKLTYQVSFLPGRKLLTDLELYLEQESKYQPRTGNHIEIRPGMINFSVVGSDATQKQRKAYNQWDKYRKEREDIVEYVTQAYPHLEASIGGSVSIDIYPIGNDKSQAVKYLYTEQPDANFIFVGDRTEPGGNDHAIVEELEEHEDSLWFKVEDWEDTQQLIRENEAFV
jgi:phosphomannomutase